VDKVVGIILVHFDLFQDYAAFPGYVFGIEYRVQNEIGENFKSDGNIFILNLDIKANAFLGGERVHIAADGIDLAGDLLGSAVLGAFEDHVLDKVRNAVGLRSLVARASLQPNADGRRADVFHLLGDDGKAVGQNLTANIANFFYHVDIEYEDVECKAF
jgi:hypothetical protein